MRREHVGAGRLLGRWALAFCALCTLVPALGATWSIVVVNRRTGEVCIASATCLLTLDLTQLTPVILVGRGGGVTQSSLDNGQNRVRIYEGFLNGDSPAAILERIKAEDAGVNTRQFGIVDFAHDPLTFTGSFAGVARKGVAGFVDDLAYAIQGNVLSDRIVIDECEAVLRTSAGDLGQRVLAAMVRARQLGGDGRCSCGDGLRGNCGVPTDFQKSAHIGFLLLARMGDTDGGCALAQSCAGGNYYLRLSIKGRNGQESSPDPVDQLVERYAEWRAARLGRPDGIRSRVSAVDSLPADGVTERTVRIQLVDLDGNALGHGGALIEVAGANGSLPLAMLGPVLDHDDGTYSFTLKAGARSGVDQLAIRASDGLVSATLYPYLELRLDRVQVLHAGFDRISALSPVDVPFVVNEPARARAKYWLFARLTGKLHGVGFDPVLLRHVVPAVAPFFPGPPGVLDANGRAEPHYSVPAGVLFPLIGLRLEWGARIFGRGAPLQSNTVALEIVP